MTSKVLEHLFFRQMMNAIGARTMGDIGDLYRDYDVIAVDEGQFFPDVSSKSFSLL